MRFVTDLFSDYVLKESISVDEISHFDFKKKSINAFSLFCIVCSAPYYAIFNVKELYLPLVIIFISHVLFALVIFLNKNRNYTLANVVLVFVTNFSVLSLSLLLGFNSGFHLYIFTTPLFLFWLFDNQNLKFVVGSFVIYLALYIIVKYYDAHYFSLVKIRLNVSGLSLYDFNAILNLLLIFLLFFSYFKYHQLLKAEQINKNNKLQEEITKRKESEENIRKLFDDLSLSYKNLEQFSYVVSHNMRAPVANIKGFISLYNRSTTDSEENANIVKYVEKSATHLDEILTDLNFILKNKNSQLEDKEEIDFDDFIENIKQSMLVEIDSTNTVIEKKFDNKQKIFTVKSVLNSIVYNLLQNAIKYKKNWESPLILIEFSSVGTNYLIKISDNGIGIDLEKFKDRVFRLYSRFHRNADGKGIGLYLVKTQVELLGGTISIDSKVNVGTSFEIVIPINR